MDDSNVVIVNPPTMPIPVFVFSSTGRVQTASLSTGTYTPSEGVRAIYVENVDQGKFSIHFAEREGKGPLKITEHF